MAEASTQKVILGCLTFALWWVLTVFAKVPFLPIGRTGGSLLTAALMVVCGVLSSADAFKAINLPVLAYRYSTMVIGVHLERADLHRYLRNALSWRSQGGKDLLCRLCIVAAISSALLTNDTTCSVLTGFVHEICKEKNLHPRPFLIALATSSNIGSAATSIGNPQNLIIGVLGDIGFAAFLKQMVLPALVGLIFNTLLILVVYWRSLSEERRCTPGRDLEMRNVVVDRPRDLPHPACRSLELGDSHNSANASEIMDDSGPSSRIGVGSFHTRSASSEQSAGALQGSEFPRGSEGWRHSFSKLLVYLVALGMIAAISKGLDISWCAMTAAVVLSVFDFRDARVTLEKVPYYLLVLLSGIFMTVEGFNKTGLPEKLWRAVEPHAHMRSASGVAVLSVLVTFLSNVAQNVPTVLLLGPKLATSAASIAGLDVVKGWLLLAWVSTIAGNLTLAGSAANVIVCEQGAGDYQFSFWEHLAYGFPSTLIVISLGVLLLQA